MFNAIGQSKGGKFSPPFKSEVFWPNSRNIPSSHEMSYDWVVATPSSFLFFFWKIRRKSSFLRSCNHLDATEPGARSSLHRLRIELSSKKPLLWQKTRWLPSKKLSHNIGFLELSPIKRPCISFLFPISNCEDQMKKKQNEEKDNRYFSPGKWALASVMQRNKPLLMLTVFSSNGTHPFIIPPLSLSLTPPPPPLLVVLSLSKPFWANMLAYQSVTCKYSISVC